MGTSACGRARGRRWPRRVRSWKLRRPKQIPESVVSSCYKHICYIVRFLAALLVGFEGFSDDDLWGIIPAVYRPTILIRFENDAQRAHGLVGILRREFRQALHYSEIVMDSAKLLQHRHQLTDRPVIREFFAREPPAECPHFLPECVNFLQAQRDTALPQIHEALLHAGIEVFSIFPAEMPSNVAEGLRSQRRACLPEE